MESMEKEINPLEDTSHLKMSSEGIVDTREEMLSSIQNEEERGNKIIDSMGGETGMEETFDKLPDEKKQGYINKIEDLNKRIDSSEKILKGYGTGDNPLKGIQEIRQLLIKARINFLAKKI